MWSEALDALAEVALVVTAADGTIEAWSAGAARLSGIAIDAAVGRGLGAVLGLPALDLGALARQLRPRLDGELVRGDGAVVAVRITARGTASGGYAVQLVDADDDRAATARYARAVGGLSDGVWEWSVDGRDGYLSPRWQAMLGLGADEVASFGDALAARLHPNDVERARSALTAHLDFGAPYDLELRLRTRSGEYRWFRVRGEAERDGRGAAERMTGIMTDIHERKVAELEVQRLNADLERRVRQQTTELRRFMSVIEASTDYIGMADVDGRLLYLNRAFREALGPHPRGELWSTPVRELYTSDVYARIESEARPAAIRDGHWLGETELRRFDGTTIPVSQLLLAHVAPAGELEYFSTIMRDATQRRRMEGELRVRAERLAALNRDLERRAAEVEGLNADLKRRAAEVEASNQELEAFSYTVSHDLRAPLRAIEGYSRIVLEDFAGQLPDELRDYLGDIRRNTLHMGRLVDELLTLSRLGRQAITKRMISVVTLVEQCLLELRPRRIGRQIDLRIGDLPPCNADRALLKQVWFNLLDNALKYTSKRERAIIEITAEHLPKVTIYSVKDNGVGFDMKYRDKLFGVFQRLHRQEEYEGTGVGLAIVQRMIQRHGGKVWAKAAPELGAQFSFSLPRATDGTEP
jgi:PAS domain S-box-containing protein